MASITFFSSAIRRDAWSIVAVLVFCFLPGLVEARPLRLLVFDVIVFNGSKAGDTTADALQRLPSALQNGADLVIVELGGNDMLNETDPQTVLVISIRSYAFATSHLPFEEKQSRPGTGYWFGQFFRICRISRRR